MVDWDKIEEEGKVLLRILNGGETPEMGEEFEIKRRAATATLAELGRKYQSGIITRVKRKNLATKKISSVSSQSSLFSSLFNVVILVFFAMGGVIILMEEIENFGPVGVLVGEEFFLPAVLCIVFVTFVICAILNHASVQYEARTENGLKASRYMDGLKLYIEMAEAERLKVLQSVDGADTSPEGVVHLYEKLLPYAAVFGLEKSWLNEMEKYYKINDVEEPEWHKNGISTTDLLIMSSMTNRYVNQATSYSTGGGGVSSGFSGGGGGGFSGGGGGGGGFSGR